MTLQPISGGGNAETTYCASLHSSLLAHSQHSLATVSQHSPMNAKHYAHIRSVVIPQHDYKRPPAYNNRRAALLSFFDLLRATDLR